MIAFALALAVLALVNLWYWIRTVGVMNRIGIVYALAGIFFAPLIQIVFYLTQKEKLVDDEIIKFKRYFGSMVLLIIAIILLPMFVDLGQV